MSNVILVKEWDGDWFHLYEIMRHLRQMGVRTEIVHDGKPLLKHFAWTLARPTKIICMNPIRNFKPDWAEIWQQKNYTKIEEYDLLEAHGIPVPKWRPVYEGGAPDLSDFSSHVVVKPAWGIRGAHVRIMRKGRVRYRPLEVEGMAGETSEALIAQEYIHTGDRPVSYRVGTVFGEPIYALEIRASEKRQSIDPYYEATGSRKKELNREFGLTQQGFGGKSIVASSKGCSFSGNVPEDVLELAGRAHDAFQDVPLLGTDILRDINTGKLYVIEVNAMGRTYNLADQPFERIRSDFGLDLRAQFGGFKTVASAISRRVKGLKARAKCVPLSGEDALLSWEGMSTEREREVLV